MAPQIVHVLGGSTVEHDRAHRAACVSACGGTARRVAALCRELYGRDADVELHLTRPAAGRASSEPTTGGKRGLEDENDVRAVLLAAADDPRTRAIFLVVALCGTAWVPRREAKRRVSLSTVPSDEEPSPHALLSTLRARRRDVILVGFSTSVGADRAEQEEAAFELLARTGVDLVVSDDRVSKLHLVVERARTVHLATTDREAALRDDVARTRAPSSSEGSARPISSACDRTSRRPSP